MTRDARAGMLTEAGLFALASVLLAQMGLGIFLFLVPLQVLYARRGERSLVLAGAAVIVAVAAIRLIGAAVRGVAEQNNGILLVELVALTLLVVGLILVDYFGDHPLPFLGVRLRAVPRLIGATLVAALLCVPVLLMLRSRPEFGQAVAGLFQNAADTVASAIAQGSRGLQLEGGVDAEGLAGRLQAVAAEVFPRSVLLYYFAILTLSWWAGNRSAARAMGAQRSRLVGFSLPELYVWPLIGSLALVLADIAFGVGFAGYVGWNVGLIMLFLYGLQGLGVVQFAFARYSVSRTLRLLTYVVLAVLFLSPGANIAVVVGLPGLGVSEIWLKYRTRRRNTDADEGDS
jgi:hypothetical protein